MIMINPLIPKRNFFVWTWRWIKFALSGGIRYDTNVPFSSMGYSIKIAAKLTRYDLTSVLFEIPMENIVIIRGKSDKYFCDDEAVKVLATCNIHLEEVDNLGHEWNEKYVEVIKRHIN